MILTCPQCSARFVVADSRIDPQRPEVSHAACGTVWVLGAEAEAKEPEATPEPALATQEQPEDDNPDFDRRRLRRQLRRATTTPHRRVLRLAVVAGGSLAVGAVVSLELLLLFEDQVAHAVPGAARILTTFGL
ncbi:MAG: zinc-ribbon domain-containing protein [Parcubacteria group bacterium]